MSRQIQGKPPPKKAPKRLKSDPQNSGDTPKYGLELGGYPTRSHPFWSDEGGLPEEFGEGIPEGFAGSWKGWGCPRQVWGDPKKTRETPEPPHEVSPILGCRGGVPTSRPPPG